MAKVVTDWFPIFVAAELRLAIAFIVLMAINSRSPEEYWNDLTKREWLGLAAVGLLGCVFYNVTLLNGIKLVPATLSSIVLSTSPAFVAAGSALFFREPFGWRKKLALAVSIMGVIFVNVDFSGQGGGMSIAAIFGTVLLLGSVFCDASYTVGGKIASSHLRPLTISMVGGICGIIAFLPLSFWQSWTQLYVTPPIEVWLTLVAWSLMCTTAAPLLWLTGVRSLEGSEAAGMMAVCPIAALIIANLALGEPLLIRHGIGIALVLVSMALLMRAETSIEPEELHPRPLGILGEGAVDGLTDILEGSVNETESISVQTPAPQSLNHL